MKPLPMRQQQNTEHILIPSLHLKTPYSTTNSTKSVGLHMGPKLNLRYEIFVLIPIHYSNALSFKIYNYYLVLYY